jgi:MSHA biogenesis protein MshP
MKPIRFVPKREAGVGLVTAIFLLVVLAGLGVAMVSLFTSQQASSDLDLMGARAYQAARSGLEWGIYRRTRNGACAARTTVPMRNAPALSAFTVVVTCTASGSGSLARFLISSTACNLPDAAGNCTPSNSAESVRRTLEVQL